MLQLFYCMFYFEKNHVLQFDKAFKREPAMSNDSVVYPLDFQVLPHIADLYSTPYSYSGHMRPYI